MDHDENGEPILSFPTPAELADLVRAADPVVQPEPDPALGPVYAVLRQSLWPELPAKQKRALEVDAAKSALNWIKLQKKLTEEGDSGQLSETRKRLKSVKSSLGAAVAELAAISDHISLEEGIYQSWSPVFLTLDERLHICSKAEIRWKQQLAEFFAPGRHDPENETGFSEIVRITKRLREIEALFAYAESRIRPKEDAKRTVTEVVRGPFAWQCIDVIWNLFDQLGRSPVTTKDSPFILAVNSVVGATRSQNLQLILKYRRARRGYETALAELHAYFASVIYPIRDQWPTEEIWLPPDLQVPPPGHEDFSDPKQCQGLQSLFDLWLNDSVSFHILGYEKVEGWVLEEPPALSKWRKYKVMILRGPDAAWHLN